ncbi:MAG: hypothetical protein ACI8P0_004673 [Planctomycetaceae bacterium]
MTFFFDNNISFRYADMLKALDVNVVALREVFPQNIKDDELLKKLASSHYVFVSGDRAMRTSTIEAPILKAARITSLYFAPFWGKLQKWDQAAWLIRRWPTIENFTQGAERGTCATVQQNGRSVPFSL